MPSDRLQHIRFTLLFKESNLIIYTNHRYQRDENATGPDQLQTLAVQTGRHTQALPQTEGHLLKYEIVDYSL
jgi:hypothetical protein